MSSMLSTIQTEPKVSDQDLLIKKPYISFITSKTLKQASLFTDFEDEGHHNIWYITFIHQKNSPNDVRRVEPV